MVVKSCVYKIGLYVLLSGIVFTSILLGNISRVYAAASNEISFSGKIVNKTSGINITNGSPVCVKSGADTCDLRVSVFAESSGGTALWSEILSDVEIGANNGVFNIKIGSYCITNQGGSWTTDGDGAGTRCAVSSGGVIWGVDSTLYVQVELDTSDTIGENSFGSPEVFTRSLLTSVPTALYSNSAGQLLDQLGNVMVDGDGTVVNIIPGHISLNDDASNLLGTTAAIGAAAEDLYWGDKLLCSAGELDCGWGSGTSLWTDGGDITYLTSTTDGFAIGGTDSTADLYIESTGLYAYLNADELYVTSGIVEFYNQTQFDSGIYVMGAVNIGGFSLTTSYPFLYFENQVVCNSVQENCGWLKSNDSDSSQILGLYKNIGADATASWSTGTYDIAARYEHASVLYNGKMYSWGGTRSGSSELNTLTIYDIETNYWSTGASGGTARIYHSANMYNNKIYFWGGDTGGAYSNAIDIYNITSNTWTTGTSGGTARYDHTGTLYNGKIYFWGGSNGSNPINTVDIYNISGNSWTTGASGGTARVGHTAVLYNDKIYFWGGRNTSGTAINTVDIYDITANSWSTGTAGGTARAQHASVLYNGKIYSWGGETDSGVLNSVDIYSILSASWTTGVTGGVPREGHTSVLFNGKIYSYGGKDQSIEYSTVNIYDIGDRQSYFALYENNESMLSFRTGATINLDYGKLNITGGNVNVSQSMIANNLMVGGNVANVIGTSAAGTAALSDLYYGDKLLCDASETDCGWGAGTSSGAGFYTVSSSGIASGSYIDLNHNQSTDNIMAMGWYYDSATSQWRQVENSSYTIKHTLQNEWDKAAAAGLVRSQTRLTDVELKPSVDTGTGADGAITVTGNTSINATSLISGRSCSDGGDAVNYSVSSLSSNSATLSSTPAAGCLAVGDEVLLINLQGTSSAVTNLGNYETLRIQNISTNTITFTTAKIKYYGDGATDDTNIGTGAGNQKVMLQRVPNYTNVTVNSSFNFYPTAWNGTKGGVMFFRANGTVSAAGNIHANASGYRGGTAANGGYGGEAFCGATGGGQGATSGTDPGDTGICGGGGGGGGAVGAVSAGGAGSASFGGGGGGGGYAQSGDATASYAGGGGGGGHATYGSGGRGVNTWGVNGGTNTSGAGGTENVRRGGGGGGGGTYTPTGGSSSATMGAGGGAGSSSPANYTSTGGAGGNGGGIVIVSANAISVSGTIASNGANGSATSSSSYGGSGGGGAGGTVKLMANSLILGTNLVSASAGSGDTTGNDGGNGGLGYSYIYYTTSYTGSANSPTPTYTVQPYYPYGLYHSPVIPTSNAKYFDSVYWLSTLNTYGKVTVQTRSGNSSSPTDGTWEAWKPSTDTTNYLMLENANTHTNWTGTNATILEGDASRNVDMFEDEDEATPENTAKITSSTAGGYVETTISSADISSYDYLTFWVRSTQTGNVVTIGIGETAATEQTEIVSIDTVDTWQKVYWDLSDISAASRNGITKIRITNNSGSSNSILFDNIRVETLANSGALIKSTPNNYLQYRIVFTTTNTSYQPRVENISVNYNTGFKIVQQDNNTVRLYNYSGSTLDMKLVAGASGGGGSTNYFTDAGAITYLTSVSDDLALGGTGASSPFLFDVSSAQLTMQGMLLLQNTTAPEIVLDNSTTGSTANSGYITLRGNYYNVTDTDVDMNLRLNVTSSSDYRLSFYNTGKTTEVGSIDESGNLQIDGTINIGTDTTNILKVATAAGVAANEDLYYGDKQLCDASQPYCGQMAPISSAPNLFYIASVGSSGWTGTINGTPSGTSVVYTNVSGSQNTLAANATYSAKQRLYNTTRGNYALISTSNGTNTITLTATVPANWASGDTITTLSPTVATAGWVDYEITATSSFYNRGGGFFYVGIQDSGAVGQSISLHPFQAYNNNYVTALFTQSTAWNTGFMYKKLTSNLISVKWTASGAASVSVSFLEMGMSQ